MLRSIFSKCISLLKIPNAVQCAKASFTHDKNFYFFRNRTEYKNLVVPLNNDPSKIIGPGFSFQLKEQKVETTSTLFSLLLQRDYVMKLSFGQLQDILCLIANSKINSQEHHSILKYLDEKCALSAERWNLDLTLCILDAWFIILGKNAFRKHYYGVITSIWSRKMKKCSKLHLILMLYFIGMSKSAPPFLLEMIEDKMENYVKDFTDEEWAIACVSFFKVSKPINSKLLLDHACSAAKNLLMNDSRFHLINILKCLRLSRHYDENLWCILSNYIKNECKTFNFVESSHFFAVFASKTLYERDLFDCLEKQGLKIISEEKLSTEHENNSTLHPSLRSRVKDIARFLWSMASVGHLVNAATLESLSTLLENRFILGEFETTPHFLVDCLQSFTMLNYFPQNLINIILQPEFINKIVHSDRAKPKYQMFFILNSIQIEYPDTVIKVKHRLISTPIPKVLSKELRERNGFKNLLELLQQNSSLNVKCCFIFPHIMIGSILLSTDINSVLNIVPENRKSCYNSVKNLIDKGLLSKHCADIFQESKFFTCIEILDPTVCISGTTEPLGLMKTKIHQLKKLNFHVITLTPEDVQTLILTDKSEHISKLLKHD